MRVEPNSLANTALLGKLKSSEVRIGICNLENSRRVKFWSLHSMCGVFLPTHQANSRTPAGSPTVQLTLPGGRVRFHGKALSYKTTLPPHTHTQTHTQT